MWHKQCGENLAELPSFQELEKTVWKAIIKEWLSKVHFYNGKLLAEILQGVTKPEVGNVLYFLQWPGWCNRKNAYHIYRWHKPGGVAIKTISTNGAAGPKN